MLVITLMVVGPKRFPEIARQGGRWFRVARRFTADITGDFRGALDELESEVSADGESLRSVREIGKDIESGMRETAADIDSIGRETKQAATAGETATAADGESTAAQEAARTPAATAHEPVPFPTASGPTDGPRKSAAELQRQVSDSTRDLRAPDEPPSAPDA